MLTIRREQFAKLEEEALAQWLTQHLDAYFPGMRELYPGKQHNDFIRDGIRRARAYGFFNGPEIVNWLNLMVSFGPRFEEDPKYSWAADTLREGEAPKVKIQKLVDRAEKELTALEANRVPISE